MKVFGQQKGWSSRRILLLVINVGLVLTLSGCTTYAQQTQMKPTGVSTDEFDSIPPAVKPNVPITGTAADTGVAAASGVDSYHVRIEFCTS